jgi:hypothetical protein
MSIEARREALTAGLVSCRQWPVTTANANEMFSARTTASTIRVSTRVVAQSGNRATKDLQDQSKTPTTATSRAMHGWKAVTTTANTSEVPSARTTVPIRKNRATKTSTSEVSAASSLANEEFNVHDMRVPTNLSKDAAQFDKGKLTRIRSSADCCE